MPYYLQKPQVPEYVSSCLDMNSNLITAVQITAEFGLRWL